MHQTARSNPVKGPPQQPLQQLPPQLQLLLQALQELLAVPGQAAEALHLPQQATPHPHLQHTTTSSSSRAMHQQASHLLRKAVGVQVQQQQMRQQRRMRLPLWQQRRQRRCLWRPRCSWRAAAMAAGPAIGGVKAALARRKASQQHGVPPSMQPYQSRQQQQQQRAAAAAAAAKCRIYSMVQPSCGCR